MFVAVSMSTLFAVASTFARADPSPNSPGPGDVFIEEKPCFIGWDVDQTGDWRTMHIDLMTGNNFDMVFLANVGIVDATDPSKATFTYACPKVTPHSPIYFYQFSTPSSSNKAWTARFVITNSSGEVVPPSQSIQPDGQNITWGMGALANSSHTSVFPSSFGASGVWPSGAASPFGVSGALASQPSAAASSFGGPVKSSPTSNAPLAPSDTTQSSVPPSSGPAPMIPSSSDVLTAGQNGAVGMCWSSILGGTGLALALGVFCFAVMF